MCYDSKCCLFHLITNLTCTCQRLISLCQNKGKKTSICLWNSRDEMRTWEKCMSQFFCISQYAWVKNLLLVYCAYYSSSEPPYHMSHALFMGCWFCRKYRRGVSELCNFFVIWSHPLYYQKSVRLTSPSNSKNLRARG